MNPENEKGSIRSRDIPINHFASMFNDVLWT